MKRPFKVTKGHPLLWQSTRHVYDFLLALNSNLTSIFDRSGDITHSLHIHVAIDTPLLRMELEKDSWELVGMLWCQGSQNIGLSNHKLKSVKEYPTAQRYNRLRCLCFLPYT